MRELLSRKTPKGIYLQKEFIDMKPRLIHKEDLSNGISLLVNLGCWFCQCNVDVEMEIDIDKYLQGGDMFQDICDHLNKKGYRLAQHKGSKIGDEMVICCPDCVSEDEDRNIMRLVKPEIVLE